MQDESGARRYPVPAYDRGAPPLSPVVRSWHERLAAAAATVGMTPDEIAAHAELDISGTYEVQTPEVQQRIDSAIDHVLKDAKERRQKRGEEERTIGIENEREMATRVHGHSKSLRLVAALPPLALPAPGGKMRPVASLDVRILGEYGAVVLYEQDEFHRLQEGVLALMRRETKHPTITLAELEDCFIQRSIHVRRYLGDFIHGQSVVDQREAIIVRVAYSFQRVDRFFICFVMRLMPEHASASYIGKDPFVCSEGWTASSKVIPVLFKCMCR